MVEQFTSVHGVVVPRNWLQEGRDLLMRPERPIFVVPPHRHLFLDHLVKGLVVRAVVSVPLMKAGSAAMVVAIWRLQKRELPHSNVLLPQTCLL